MSHSRVIHLLRHTFISSDIHSPPPSFISRSVIVIHFPPSFTASTVRYLRVRTSPTILGHESRVRPKFLRTGLERGITGAPSHQDRASSCGDTDGTKRLHKTAPPGLKLETHIDGRQNFDVRSPDYEFMSHFIFLTFINLKGD